VANDRAIKKTHRCPHCGREAAKPLELSWPQLRALRWCEQYGVVGALKPIPRRRTIVSLISRGLIDEAYKPTEAGYAAINEKRGK